MMRLLCAVLMLCLTAAPLRAGGGVRRDVPYGAAALQTMDVYLPANAPTLAPVILMVHGGAWVTGDKANPQVVANKVEPGSNAASSSFPPTTR